MEEKSAIMEHLEYIISGVVATIGGVVMVIKWLGPRKKSESSGGSNGTQRELGKLEANVEELLKQNSILFTEMRDIRHQLSRGCRDCELKEETKDLRGCVEQCRADIAVVKAIVDQRKSKRDDD